MPSDTPYPVPRWKWPSHQIRKKERADSNHGVSLRTLQQYGRDRTNGKWKDPIRLPIIEDRQGHVRRRPSDRDPVLFGHSPTAVRRNGKDHPKHHVSPKTTLTVSHRRIHGRQTSPTDRIGRFDAPSRTERGHGIVFYTGMSPPQTERRVHHT